eukprot:GHVR01027008.1.p1 GENE.GHVR01027008.1~~GHVR01027008.1.p1  ORF type:complete len:130 (+),score=0.46 GHVR01027008.1:1851-2240(+)
MNPGNKLSNLNLPQKYYPHPKNLPTSTINRHFRTGSNLMVIDQSSTNIDQPIRSSLQINMPVTNQMNHHQIIMKNYSFTLKTQPVVTFGGTPIKSTSYPINQNCFRNTSTPIQTVPLINNNYLINPLKT